MTIESRQAQAALSLASFLHVARVNVVINLFFSEISQRYDNVSDNKKVPPLQKTMLEMLLWWKCEPVVKITSRHALC